jgi:NADPH-dependent 2,4-dienoyl-CoA reductase/sulfur reductase-like enzyme
VRFARVQAESHIRTPENADSVISSAQADLVSVVRGQIADPHWVRKALAGQDDRVRGCISCNQMCWGRRSRDYWISCLVNPAAGRELEWGGEAPAPVRRRRHLLVVGGGPAGLEAARVAAQRGLRVTLAEAGPTLGGAFRLAGLQPRRSQITELIDWYARSLHDLGVEVRTGTPLDGEEALAVAADEIVVATGSQPAESGFQRALPDVDRLPGVGASTVASIEDVLTRSVRPGRRVVVLDDLGDWRGAGTAWHLAEAGHEVVLVTGWPLVGFWIQRTASDGALRGRLARLGVTWHTESVVTSWSGQGAVVRSLLSGIDRLVPADTLVLATTNVPCTELVEDLRTAPGKADRRVPVHVIGDALAARLAVHAIVEGRRLGLQL